MNHEKDNQWQDEDSSIKQPQQNPQGQGQQGQGQQGQGQQGQGQQGQGQQRQGQQRQGQQGQGQQGQGQQRQGQQGLNKQVKGQQEPEDLQDNRDSSDEMENKNDLFKQEEERPNNNTQGF